MLSVGYGELENDASAMQEAQTYLAFARQTKNSVWEKQALSLIGSLHRKFKRPSQAITAYQQALAISDNNQVTGADSVIYAKVVTIIL